MASSHAPTFALRVGGTIFGLMSVAQLIRLVTRAEIRVGAYQLPLWASMIAMVVAGMLCFWLWHVSYSKSLRRRSESNLSK